MRNKLYLGISLLLLLSITISGIACTTKPADRVVADCQELYNAREFEACRNELRKLLSGNQDYPEARSLLVRAELALGDLGAALENLVLLPLASIKSQSLDILFLSHLQPGTGGELYALLEGIGPEAENYAWSRGMLVQIAAASGDQEALTLYLSTHRDIVGLDAAAADSAWKLAWASRDPELVCSVADLLGSEHKLELAAVLSTMGEELGIWLPAFTAIADTPDLLTEAAWLHRSLEEYESGLALIANIESTGSLPADREHFSFVKFSLLFYLDGELSEALLTNLTVDHLARLASYRQSIEDKDSFNNIMAKIEASDSPQLPLIRGIFKPPAAPARLFVAKSTNQVDYNMDCDHFSMSPDGQNLLWVDWGQFGSSWWNAASRKIVALEGMETRRMWSADGRYVAQWTADDPMEIIILTAANMEKPGQVPWTGGVLGWSGDKFYTLGHTLHEFTASTGQTANFQPASSLPPILSPDGDINYVSVSGTRAAVESAKINKSFDLPIDNVSEVKWLQKDAGLLMYSEDSGRYYTLDFATGKTTWLEALGSSFMPLFNNYLWDGRTLYGLQPKVTEDENQYHLFKYEIPTGSLRHTGIIYTAHPEMLAISSTRVALVTYDGDLVIYELK